MMLSNERVPENPKQCGTFFTFCPRQKLNERSHKVRLAIGNGMRVDVWRDFLSRFGDIEIREFYGATEGNFVLLNYVSKIGAVGRDTFLHQVQIHVSIHNMK